MTGDDEAMQDEFGALARWTHEAVLALGRDHALPAACRGSGKPAVLDWLLDGLAAEPGAHLLDVGAGLGGPPAYARDRARVRPVCVDPMVEACAAAASLFGLPSLVADGSRLPFADRRFGLAWSLGTLCTTTDKDLWLRALHRVLRPGGRLGLLVLVATGASFSVPWGNAFPSEGDLLDLLEGAGFAVLQRGWSDELPAADPQWQAAEDAVRREVEAVRGGDPRLARIKHQESRLGALLEGQRIRGHLLVARADV